MKYLVMECHPGYAVLLDEEGRFLKAANLHYEVGQTVQSPVLMREKPYGRRRGRWIASGIMAAAAACLLLFFGVTYYQNNILTYSSIYLTINPEIQMDLNRKGIVVELTGTNEDGEELLEGYDGRGKDKIMVSDELIDRAIEMGFLSEGGMVSFSIDSPDDALYQEYGKELMENVTEYLDGRITITIEVENYRTSDSGYGDSEYEDEQPENSVPETPAQRAPEVQTPEAPVQQTPETPAQQAPATPAPQPQAPADSDYDDGDSGYDDGGDSGYDD